MSPASTTELCAARLTKKSRSEGLKKQGGQIFWPLWFPNKEGRIAAAFREMLYLKGGLAKCESVLHISRQTHRFLRYLCYPTRHGSPPFICLPRVSMSRKWLNSKKKNSLKNDFNSGRFSGYYYPLSQPSNEENNHGNCRSQERPQHLWWGRYH